MNKPLVLVVEDDTPVRNLITTTLKTHEYRYLSAQNGASAVMEALSHNPDIVLLDLGLPDMDGVEIIRKIRSWSNMPIIVISARTEDSDKIGALDAGADDYLTKPFSVDELLARLRVTQRRLALMKADTAQETPIFTNGALKIDYAADTFGETGFWAPQWFSFNNMNYLTYTANEQTVCKNRRILRRICFHQRQSSLRHPQPCQQFVHGKGLRQVIVRPGIQRPDFIGILRSGTDHNDRHIRPRTDFPYDLHAVHIRESQIKQHNIRIMRQRLHHRACAVLS